MSFGKFLKEKRQSKGYTLRQMAYKTGFSHTYISDIEKEVAAKLETIEKIADVLELTEEDRNYLIKEIEYFKTPDNVLKELNQLKEKGNAIKLDHKIIDLPVYGRASAGPGYINLDNQISTKRVIANGFSPDSFIVEVTGDSMSYEINDGDWAVVDPQQRDYVENKVYVVTYEEETFIKQIVCPAKGMVVLKSFNGKYEDKYVMKETLSSLKVEGRVVKVISEKRF